MYDKPQLLQYIKIIAGNDNAQSDDYDDEGKGADVDVLKHHLSTYGRRC